MHTSLDGFVSGPNGEIDWVKVDEEIFDYTSKLTMTMLFTTAEERNQVAEKYGAVEGLKQNMDKLGEYLAKTKVG